MDSRIKSLFGLNEAGYLDLRFNINKPIVHTALCDDDLHVLYFDSDGGCALFSSPREIYEEFKVTFELIDCKYCDFTLSDLQFVYKIFKSFSQGTDNES